MSSRIILCFAALLAGAADWPEFRGPDGQGHSTEKGLPVVWSATKNVVWKQATEGNGWSSPIVVGNRVYVTSAAAKTGSENLSLRAQAFEAATGKPVWDVEVFVQDAQAPKIHGKNSHASPTPLIYDGRLYVHFGHQGTACLNLGGKVLWRNRDLVYKPQHGNGGSPIVADDKLIFSCDGSDKRFVAALHCGTGKLAWKTERGWDATKKFSFGTPLLIKVDGKSQVISPGSSGVAAYDPADGKEIWRVLYEEGYSVIPRPVFGGGLVFVSTSYDRPQLLAIRPNGVGDVTKTHVVWKTKVAAPHTPSPLLVGDDLYIVSDDGFASCLDAFTGTPYWKQRLGGHYSASPLYAEGHVYFQSEEGVGTVIKAGRSYELLNRNDLEERTLASYAAADGALFIRSEKHLFRIQSR